MTPAKRLQIGLIGYGPYAMHLARMALNTTAADISLIWTRSEKTKEQIFANGFVGTNDIDELINSPKVEAIIVASPNSLHKEHCLKVCVAKKPLWAEKPLVLSLEDYDEIIKAVEKAKVITHCNFGMRFGGVSRKLIELADAGEFGKPLHLIHRIDRSVGLFCQNSAHKAVLTPELSGGWILHHMCHQVDFVLRLTRERVVSVFCKTAKSASECPSEEAISAILTTQSGAIACLNDGLTQQHTEFLEYVGTKASGYTIDHKSLFIRGFDAENKARYGHGGHSIQFTPESYGDDAMRAFVQAVTGEKADTGYPVNVVPIQEGRHVLEVLLAMKQSEKTGKVVEVG
ncbi:MAG: hypothetical protein A2268_08665 [Candidatus Raymondbacteria bacterium RifOxyA12_full_50_37]|uniref:Oxidoreductase n=1 Tax=Candidatus Raymondbacteria bacterium RIFOXYD12_FULL_49_13 TaxID=1817890 RepID=A0A1F7F004_UNCRA|nr:MAG: hypothetical protein A2268_08665 [Candidatus Raymondbacteria bacterium RifOxyA12_full_50_37]OGJ92684.1 MAG: hypothetical protein A2248_07690 [Candidatus Raymondbacteria bacterium RIFOXYA2_FULL_49_16]OGJ93086.1 MAG: hypothetical protein A2487_10185 [Candidatus Raymondbacteria bacterium RifOxyC12_full_50_8]OGJ99029.1 MAG: hypothetical protein A2453_06090 [Candidatus Raymondbacteria bacterium RIFOXYC2_FULL_50_21]OGJ99835.1 MAG: hypothetical protein A2519_17330 [Candidatus Raymondbacteria b